MQRTNKKWRRIDIKSDDKSIRRCRESDLCMNGPRTQKCHDQLGQNSQVCKEKKSRRKPAEDGLVWASPWFGRTLISIVKARVRHGHPGLHPNDGWRALWTFPLPQPSYLPLYKDFTFSLHSHTSSKALSYSLKFSLVFLS